MRLGGPHALEKRKIAFSVADSIFIFLYAYGSLNFTGVMGVVWKNFGTFPVK
jgi:hypothetical protein